MSELRFCYKEVISKQEVDDEREELVSYISPQIRDNGEVIYDGRNVEDVEKITHLLNDLNSENLKLKENISKVLDYYRKCPIAMTKGEFKAYNNLKDMGL